MAAAGARTRVLLLEDDPVDAMLLSEALQASRWDFEVVRADRLRQGRELLLGGADPDVVLLDLGLPDSVGLDTLVALRAEAPDVPIVVLTEIDDDQTTDAALRSGAQDYLVKGGSTDDGIARAIRHAIERQRMATQVDRHLQQRGALVDLGRFALSGARHAAVAQRGAELVATGLGVPFGAVIDRDVENGTLVLAGSYGFERDEQVLELPEDETTLAGRVARANATEVVDGEGELRDPILREHGIRSAACVPIPDGDGPIGVLAALSQDLHGFEPGDVEFLEAVANLLSEAFHRRANEQALVERAKERSALFRVSRALAEQDLRSNALHDVAVALVQGVQHPEIAVALITVDDTFVVHPYGVRAPVSSLTATIEVDGRTRGELRVGYTERRAFLPEEQQLLDEAATSISVWLAREDAAESARNREAFLTSLLTQVPGTIWTTDRDLRFLSSRGAAMVRHDLVEEHIVGRTIGEIVGELSPGSSAVEAHRRALAGEPSSYRYEIDNETHWQAYVQPLRDGDGSIVGVIGSSIDITDSIRNQRQLQETERRLESLLAQAPISIWSTDEHLVVTSIRGRLAHGEDVDVRHLIGLPLAQVLDGSPDAESALESHRAALGGASAQYSITWQGITFEARVEPLRGEDDEIVGVAGAALDVTALRRAKRKLEESQQQLEGLFANALDGFLLWADDGRFVDANPAMEALTGYSRDELLTMRMGDLAPASFKAQALELAERVRRGERFTREYVLVRKDGSQLRVEGNAVPEIVPGINLATVRDITARKTAEEALRQSEARFRRLAEHAPDIIYRMSVDPQIGFEYISPAVETILGYTMEEVYADPHLVIEVLQPEQRELVHQTRTGAPPLAPLELPVQHRDGHTVWLEVRQTPVTDDAGQIVAVEGVARDISEKKLAEETLREALAREVAASERLREIDRMKNGFLQAVSHELRTPLTGVVGFSALLKHPERLDRERYMTLVSRLNANAQRLERLLTDLLDVDRMTRGALEPNRAPTDVFDLVGRVAEDFVAEGRVVHVDGDAVVAAIDGPKTERLVENLLRNAVRHAPGDAPVQVTIGAVEEGVLLTVADRGPGVPDELKQALFEPFRQGDTEASKVGGLGVGLAVVDTFARLHGGRAWVEDREGGGAVFRVLLPAPIDAPDVEGAASGTRS